MSRRLCCASQSTSPMHRAELQPRPPEAAQVAHWQAPASQMPIRLFHAQTRSRDGQSWQIT